jgi:hypothetical protein
VGVREGASPPQYMGDMQLYSSPDMMPHVQAGAGVGVIVEGDNEDKSSSGFSSDEEARMKKPKNANNISPV